MRGIDAGLQEASDDRPESRLRKPASSGPAGGGGVVARRNRSAAGTWRWVGRRARDPAGPAYPGPRGCREDGRLECRRLQPAHVGGVVLAHRRRVPTLGRRAGCGAVGAVRCGAVRTLHYANAVVQRADTGSLRVCTPNGGVR